MEVHASWGCCAWRASTKRLRPWGDLAKEGARQGMGEAERIVMDVGIQAAVWAVGLHAIELERVVGGRGNCRMGVAAAIHRLGLVCRVDEGEGVYWLLAAAVSRWVEIRFMFWD